MNHALNGILKGTLIIGRFHEWFHAMTDYANILFSNILKLLLFKYYILTDVIWNLEKN